MQIQDRLIAALRRYCQALPDQRRGKNTTYAMTDFALAAFARFFMQSLSFLAHQRHLETGHGRSNCETLFDMSKIPRDNQIRVMLDPIEPALFYPLFADIVAELQQCGGLDAMRALDGHVLIAWDGTAEPLLQHQPSGWCCICDLPERVGWRTDRHSDGSKPLKRRTDGKMRTAAATDAGLLLALLSLVEPDERGV